MSDVLERTLTSLPKILAQNLLGSSSETMEKAQKSSKAYHDLVQCIMQTRSKTDEREYIQREISLLETILSRPNLPHAQVKDCLLRAMLCGTLGYDVSFVHIHALKLAQSASLNLKRLGYLAATILLDENHELSLLLINTIIKDLQSSHIPCVYMSLIAAGQLVSADMIAAVLPSLLNCLKHNSGLVRKRAVSCLHKFLIMAPDLLRGCEANFRAALGDKDPGVMEAALPIYHHFIVSDPGQYSGMLSGFIHTLSQVIHHRLPADHVYHSIPAPWTQISLLRIITLLTKHDLNHAELVYPVLKEVLQRASSNENIAFAIMYECVASLTSICPHPELLETASGCVGNFLKSSNNNFRYIGLEALEKLVTVAPRLANDQQLKVIECLADPDLSIQRKTYDILCQLANETNVVIICDKLTDFIAATGDRYTRAELLAKLADIVARFSPDIPWYVTTTLKLLELAGDECVNPSLVSQFYDSLRQKSAEDNTRQCVVDACNAFITRDKLSNTLLKVVTWCIGEYWSTGPISRDTLESVMHHYCLTDTDATSQSYIVSAFLKLHLRNTISCDAISNIAPRLTSRCKGQDVMQRIRELCQISRYIYKMDADDSSMQSLSQNLNRVDVDFTLSFLDKFACDSIERGESPYIPRHLRSTAPPHKLDRERDVRATTIADSDVSFTETIMESVTHPGIRASDSRSSQTSSDFGPCILKMENVKRVWDLCGYRSMDDDRGEDRRSPATNQKNDLAKAIFGDS